MMAKLTLLPHAGFNEGHTITQNYWGKYSCTTNTSDIGFSATVTPKGSYTTAVLMHLDKQLSEKLGWLAKRGIRLQFFLVK